MLVLVKFNLSLISVFSCLHVVMLVQNSMLVSVFKKLRKRVC